MKKLIFTLTIAFVLNGNYSSQCLANEIPINQALKVETADLLVSHAANIRNYIEANPELLELTENEIDSIIYIDFVNTVFGSENDYICEIEYLDSLLNLLFDVYQISPTAPNRVNLMVENLISEDYIDISSYPPCTQAYMIASIECAAYAAKGIFSGPATAGAVLIVCQSAAYTGFCGCLFNKYNGGCEFLKKQIVESQIFSNYVQHSEMLVTMILSGKYKPQKMFKALNQCKAGFANSDELLNCLKIIDYNLYEARMAEIERDRLLDEVNREFPLYKKLSNDEKYALFTANKNKISIDSRSEMLISNKN